MRDEGKHMVKNQKTGSALDKSAITANADAALAAVQAAGANAEALIAAWIEGKMPRPSSK